MRRSVPLALALASSVFLLAACAPEPSTPPTSAPSPSASAVDASPSATPTAAAEIVYSLDGLALVDGAGTASTASFDDAAAILALVEDATGRLPEPTEVEDLPGYQTDWVRYVWDGVDVRTDTGGVGVASVMVTAPTVDGVVIRSADGLGVGSTRDDLVAAGAQDGWDADGDGIADVLHLGLREAPGTISLQNPGATGSLYIEFDLEDDVATSMRVGNDFSDL